MEVIVSPHKDRETNECVCERERARETGHIKYFRTLLAFLIYPTMVIFKPQVPVRR